MMTIHGQIGHTQRAHLDAACSCRAARLRVHAGLTSVHCTLNSETLVSPGLQGAPVGGIADPAPAAAAMVAAAAAELARKQRARWTSQITPPSPAGGSDGGVTPVSQAGFRRLVPGKGQGLTLLSVEVHADTRCAPLLGAPSNPLNPCHPDPSAPARRPAHARPRHVVVQTCPCSWMEVFQSRCLSSAAKQGH